MLDKKGQMTVIGIVTLVVGLIVLGAFMPIIVETVTTASSCATGNAATVLQLIPFMFAIGLLISIVIYATGGNQQYRQA